MQPKMCSKCKKNIAVVFITKVENGVTLNEGYCLKCARSLGIPQIDQAVKQMGISEEDLDMLSDEMSSMFGQRDDTDRDEDVASGLITALLQTVLGIDSLLAGIVVNTGLYSINIAVMNKSSLLNLNNSDTVFSLLKQRLEGTVLEGRQTLIIATLSVILVVLFLSLFLKTKLGLSIRATGNNPDMVKSSSINPIVTTIIGLCIANSFTALSGCLLAQSQKQAEINIGTGMVTVALASLLIGGVFVRRGKIPLRALGAVLGAIVFRLVYQIAIGLHMPPFMLKLVSSVIVIIAIAGPYLKTRLPEYIRKAKLRSGRKV